MSDNNHDDHHGVGHVVPVSLLVQVLIALLALTGLTVYTAQELDLGWLNIWVAMGIASLKAFLVVAFFMHLRRDKPFNQIVFIGTIVFVGLFMAFSLMDTRAYRHQVRTGDAPFVQESYDEGKKKHDEAGGSGH